MEDHVYKIVEVVGTSSESIDAAIRAGIARASETVRNLRWFEILHVRGYLADGAVAQFQATLKIGFTLD